MHRMVSSLTEDHRTNKWFRPVSFIGLYLHPPSQLWEDKASVEAASNQRDGEGFVEEVVFGLSPEGEGKEHSRLRGNIEMQKEKLYWGQAVAGRSKWMRDGEGEISDKFHIILEGVRKSEFF